MKVAAAQIDCAVGEIETNLAKIREFVSRAKDRAIDLIVFPEMSDTGYSMPVIQKQAAPWDEGAVPELKKMAKEFSVAIACGVSERVKSSIYNSQIVVDQNGEIVASYRKTHLFSPAPVEEHKCFSPGHQLSDVAQGDFHFGLSICYDLRFPELYRALACDRGVNVFVISSAWPFPRVEHLRILSVARSIENQSYVVLSNRVGKDGSVPFCGTSAIIDPYGVVVAAASTDREELLTAELSREVLESVRKRMPTFEHRRRDLY
jgi:predicted amidohydrolase